MNNQLTEGNKNRLRNNIIVGAQNFEKYLNGKCFKIVCADGTQTEIRFFQDDFKHLTGIDSDLDEGEFYTKCLNGLISTGNILTDQKYNWATLKGKSNRIVNIHELLYMDANKTLLLNELETHTYIFPVAIKNDDINTCVGFAGGINKARSLRKATASQNAKETKVIVEIFGKKNGEKEFVERVYVKRKDSR